jgi:hypothetical protein
VHHDRLVVIHKAIGHGCTGNHSHVQQEPQSREHARECTTAPKGRAARRRSQGGV